MTMGRDEPDVLVVGAGPAGLAVAACLRARGISLRLRSECDSEVLLRLVEASEHPAAGLELCLRETRGSMAVALYLPSQRARISDSFGDWECLIHI